jgi:DNA-binding LacI/PurR family transcriptional regulator
MSAEDSDRSETARPVTSLDVARRARVSRATVSYVLNGKLDSRISPDTRARVEAAAADLGYTPHAMARSLRTGRSNLILLPQPPHPPGPLLDAFIELLQARLRELGYLVVLHGDRRGLDVHAARLWASMRPVGAIVWTEHVSAEAVEVLRNAGTRAFLALGMRPCPPLPSLLTQIGEGIGACAATHLVARGHTSLGVIVPREAGIRELGLARLAGVERVTAERGLRVRHFNLTYDEAAAERLARQWRAAPPCSAVFTYNDEFGMLLMRALQDAGLRVPEDVALVGADNLPLCTLLRPRLSSVALDIQASAQAIANALHARVIGEAPEDAAPITIDEPRIVVRESSG